MRAKKDLIIFIKNALRVIRPASQECTKLTVLRALFSAIEGVMEWFADLEVKCFFGGHLRFFSGLGVSGNLAVTLLQPEVSEAPDFDLLAPCKCVLHSIEDRVNYCLYLFFSQSLDLFRNLFDQHRFRHFYSSPDTYKYLYLSLFNIRNSPRNSQRGNLAPAAITTAYTCSTYISDANREGREK